MRLIGIMALVAFACPSFGQQAFDVASVKPSQQLVGKDYNNRISIGDAGVRGRNVTLKRLIQEGYSVAPYQVSAGPRWLDSDEYELEAKSDRPATKEELRSMLRSLLTDRFRLVFHRETKEMRVYELVVDQNGPRIRPSTSAEAGPGFHGTLQEFANLLSVQLTIPTIEDPTKPAIARGAPAPVIDRTGLSGVYDIRAEVRPEIGADMVTLWQRVLQEQLGLKLENRRSNVEVLVVDTAERTPIPN